MARLFDDGSSEYLERDSAPATATPLTIACWFYQDDVAIATNRALLGIFDRSVTNQWFVLKTQMDASYNKFVHAETRSSSGWDRATATAQFSGNTWHHAAAVFTSPTSRTVYLDGGNSATNTTSATPSGLDRISVARLGDSSPGNYFSGRIAEVAIWNVALTDAEVAILAADYSPLFVRPQNLVAYWSLIRDEDQDRVGGYDLTAFNTPSIAAHPAVYYPVSPHI